MITKHIKYLALGLLLLFGYSSQLEASLIETPLTWTINSGSEHIAAEALPGNTDGYLDFVWDGTFVVYGFYKNQTISGLNNLDCGIYLSTNVMYIRHNNTWYYQGNIASAGDHFRVFREGSDYTIYHNGAVLYTGNANDPAMTVYPYIMDFSGLHSDRLEYFKKPPVYSLDWIANDGNDYLASNELRRGQDGFMEFTYSNNHVYFGFSNSKNDHLSKHKASIWYFNSSKRMYTYIDGVIQGSIYVPLNVGDKLTLERKGSTVIFSAGNAEMRYAIDGNIDWHPWVREYVSGMKNQLKGSFITKGGVCQDYFNNLPVYVNVNPYNYYPPSPVNENWNLVHTKTYNGEGEGPCHVISESRSYANEKGQPVQQQSKDYLTDKVWATESIYDYLGRPALATLAAPTGINIIQYHPNFIRDAQGNPYGLDDFDRTFNSSGTQTSNKTNSPNPLGTQTNTLGAWYSSANTEEPWQATTQYPYTRTEYSEVSGGARYTAAPGDAQRMGNGHEVVSFSMRTGNELRYVIGEKKPLCLLVGTAYDEGGFLSATCSAPGTVYNSRFVKTITVDPDGKAVISFQDENGNEIAQAISGKVNGSNVKIQSTTLGVPANEYRDIHVTDADNSISVWGSGVTYDVYDLTTDQKIVSDGTASSLTLSPGFYRFVSKTVYVTLNYNLNYYNFSLSIYDKQNRRIATVAPKDVVYDTSDPQHNAFTFYRYNSYGQLLWEESPDAGRTSYLYRKDGQIRFSQDAEQASKDDFIYARYDKLGREIEAGRYIQTIGGSFSSLSSSVDNDIYPSYAPYKKEEYYTTFEESDPSLPANREQQFVQGTVAKVSNDDGTTWYSYDQEGRMSWMGQSISGLSGIKYTDYKYDLLGNVTEVISQEEQSDEFRHHYTYDDNSQMTSASTRIDGKNSTVPKLQAQYQYTSTGVMDRVNLADGLERKHYVYTLQGSLKAINPKDMASADINSHQRTFSMALDYYPDDYVAANGAKAGKVSNLIDEPSSSYDGQSNYSGLVAAQRWKARAEVGGSDFTGHFAYGYRYNHRNEFDRAAFGRVNPNSSSTYDGAFSQMHDYKVLLGTNAYDLNGNIKQLHRYGQNGVIMDYLVYNYDYSGGKNRLIHIDDQVGQNPVGDLGPQGANNYSYDLVGRMIEDASEDNKLIYNAAGRVLDVRSRTNNNLKVSYKYGPNGQRVKKLSYNSSGTLTKTTWYLRGSGGGVQSVYEKENNGSISLAEVAVYGAGRLGTAFHNGGSYNYQYDLKDYLGNVRAVIEEGTSGDAEALYYADYYPYGWTLPGRNGGVSRYGYQGGFAEKDEEVGWNAFELRMYDGRLARWASIDPYKQYWSPYLSMGNDPINGIDPDGGFDTKLGAWWWKFWNGGDGISYVEEGDFWQVYGNDVGLVVGVKGRFWTDAAHFSLGLANSFASNNGIGPRYTPQTNAFYYGQVAGDIGSTIQGVVEIGAGASIAAGGTGFGVVTSPTGVGAVVGAGVAVGGVAVVAHGGFVATNGVHNLLFAKGPSSSGRKLWRLTKEGSSRILRHNDKKFGKFYKSKTTGLWWSVDKAGHGGSKFKVFEETKNGLQWIYDADEYGDFILGKHKGPTGLFIPWKHLN